MQAYASGDPYLAFAKQAGRCRAMPPSTPTPPSATSSRHAFSPCSTAWAPRVLAYRINKPVARARELLDLHRRTYRRFWAWSDGVLHQALLGGRLWTTYGWQLFVDDTPNGRSLCNFPMQANGAEMLRLACIRLIGDGVRICAPVHDAILIEAPLADLDDVVAHTQAVMRPPVLPYSVASCWRATPRLCARPERYMDKRGVGMWNTVMDQLGLDARKIGAGGRHERQQPVPQRDTHLSRARDTRTVLSIVYNYLRRNTMQAAADTRPVKRLAFNPATGTHEVRMPTAKFIKGPIPLEWISRANALPGKAGAVGMALWFLAGVQNSRPSSLPARSSKLPGAAERRCIRHYVYWILPG